MTTLNTFINAICPTIDYLASRWSDEKEYEDFTEYKARIIKEATPHKEVSINKITSRPFAVHFKIKGDRKDYALIVKRNAIQLRETV